MTIKKLRKAAEQGDDCAQFCLGVEYYLGENVPKDHVEAVKWYLKAAEQGNDDAQFTLAIAYYAGDGVQEDHTAAWAWLANAAEQGNVEALSFLAKRKDEWCAEEECEDEEDTETIH